MSRKTLRELTNAKLRMYAALAGGLPAASTAPSKGPGTAN